MIVVKGEGIVHARDYSVSKKGFCFEGDKVSHRWCIKVRRVVMRWSHWRDNTNVWFSVFLDFRKVGNFAFSIERPKAKSDSASGGRLRPFDP